MTPGAEAIQLGTEGGNEDKIFTILFDQDELSWQNIIYELIKSEKMDPWNIDVSTIAEKFIKLLAEMKKMDFRISGKVILAAAFFLKIKSDKLLKEDIALLDSLIQPLDNPEDFLDMLEDSTLELPFAGQNKPTLVVRTPQPRKRKVSVYDLINSLEKALETEQKRSILKFREPVKKMKRPQKSQDITIIINDLYKKISKTLSSVKVVWFNQLVPSDTKEEKINVFIPLLHLDTQRKIDISQKEHFGDIQICLAKLAKQYAEPN